MIKEFVSGKKSWIFSGLPPVPGITKQRQLDAFSAQVAQNLNMPKIQACGQLGLEKGGSISRCLDDLALAGFIQEDCTWNLLTKGESRLKKFRLKDNYLRFYLRYIEPNKEKIAKELFGSKSFMHTPGWESVMGLQIESSVIEEMEKKVENLFAPKGFSIRPVLIHMNGVSRAVIESEVFYNIVGFSKFFEP